MSSTIESVNLTKEAMVFGDPHLQAEGDLLALRYDVEGMLWSVEEPGILRQWNPATGQALAVHSLSDLETAWCFGPHARLLASASDDLSIWDPKTGDLLLAMPQSSWVTSIAFHPLKAVVATGHDEGKVRLWDINKQQVLHELNYHAQPISSLAFSPDGQRLAVGSEDKRISLWETGDGQRIGILEGHKDRISALQWHPKEDILVSGGWDTTARVWDVNTFEPIILLNYHDTQVFSLAFSPDGSLLATADSGHQIPIWDFSSKKILHVMKEGNADYRFLAFNRDGTQLAAATERIIRLWDPYKGKSVTHAAAAQVGRIALSLSPDGSRLVTQGSTGLQVWDTTTRKTVLHLKEENPVQSVACSPDGKWVIGGTENHIRVWETASGRAVGILEGPKEAITALAISPDSKIVAAGGMRSLPVWLFRVEDGEPILLIPDPLDGCLVEALSFHPQGRLLGVAGIDPVANGASSGATTLWDIVDRCEVALFPGGARDLAFSKSGEHLATASVDQTVCIWDVDSKQLLTELLGHQDAVHAVAYSPDGKWLASGGDDLTVRLWDTSNGNEISRRELNCQIKKLLFSKDGSSLYIGGGNAVCYCLDLQKFTD